MDAVKLPRHEDACIKVRDHAHGLKSFDEVLIFRGNIKTRHATNLLIAQRGNQFAKVARFHAHVGIVEDQVLVLGFTHHQPHFRNLIVDRSVPGAVKQPNLALRKVAHQFLDYGNGRVALVGGAENQFVLGIILAA